VAAWACAPVKRVGVGAVVKAVVVVATKAEVLVAVRAGVVAATRKTKVTM